MVYTTHWEKTRELLENSEFALVQEVFEYLDQVSEYVFSYLRKTTLIPKLEYLEAPFSEKERFPEYKLFLSSTMGTWRKGLSHLELAVQVMTSPSRLSRDYPDYKTEGEAEVYALRSIAKIREAIRNDYLSREKFETFFWLNWVD